ncbi:MAG: prepilin-type N-terminal cleavage/methylation domain-containing protein [Mycoplasmatales bacterium]
MLINNQGYTLMEMLIVLFCLSTCLLVINLNVYEVLLATNVNAQVKLFISEYNKIQLEALETKENKRITFSTSEISFGKQKVELKHGLVVSNNFNDVITLNQFGNISRAGTVVFTSGNHQKKIVFSLGAGHYRVE